MTSWTCLRNLDRSPLYSKLPSKMGQYFWDIRYCSPAEHIPHHEQYTLLNVVLYGIPFQRSPGDRTRETVVNLATFAIDQTWH